MEEDSKFNSEQVMKSMDTLMQSADSVEFDMVESLCKSFSCPQKRFCLHE